MTDIVFLILGLLTGFAVCRFITIRKKKSYTPENSPAIGKPTGFETPATPKEASELMEKLWHEEETDFIFRLIEQISFTVDQDLISRYIVEEVYKFLNTNVCVLFLWDEETERLKMKFAKGLEQSQQSDLSFMSGESITGMVLESKSPLMINELEKDSFYRSYNKEDYLRNSFISVPMMVKNEVIGVLDVANKRNNIFFPKKDLEFLLNVARVGASAIKNSRLLQQINEGYLKTITTLALIIDARDPYTKRHSENVTRYSLAIADEMRFNATQKEILRRAALLHDIGKIAIRDDVLLKSGKLTTEEYEQIKMHAVRGEEIVKSLPFLKDVANLVRHHHERYDGKGYPDGRSVDGIELGAKIMAVADTFDAMTTDRPYRKALTLEMAKEELLRNKSIQFDPRVVDNFVKVLELNPAILEK
jgi:putative nucleotidyltransferase with HDIG domain